MLTHKYPKSLRGFGPVCARSLPLESTQNTHVADHCMFVCVLIYESTFKWLLLHCCMCELLYNNTQLLFLFFISVFVCVFPGNTQLPCSAEMLREVRRHSCSGDLESVLTLANISAAFCTVFTFTYCWCIWLHVEIILPGNQQIFTTVSSNIWNEASFKQESIIPENDLEQSVWGRYSRLESWKLINQVSSVFIWNFETPGFPGF